MPAHRPLVRVHSIVLGLAAGLAVVMLVEALLAVDGGLQVRLFNGDESRYTLTLRDGRDVVKVRSRGPMELRDVPATGEAMVRPGARGSFRIEAKEGGERRRLEVTAGEDGEPRYAYEVDGDAHPFDDDARRWLEGILLECFRTGLDAEGRAVRLYEAGGAGAVVAELTEIDGDDIAGRYLMALLGRADVPDADLVVLLRAGASSVGGDHAQLEVLRALDPGRLSAPEVAAAYLDAAATLGGDHALRRALEHALEGPPPGAAWQRFFEVAESIGGDHEASELIIHFADAEVPRPRPSSLYAFLGSIDGDHAQRRAAMALAEGAGADQVEALLEAVDLGSDHEMAELLVFLAGQAEADAPTSLRTAVERATASLGSDHERRRVEQAWGLASPGR